MAELKDLFQTADWKHEKHVPVIEVIGTPSKGENINVKVTVGKEIPHPNTTEHHIMWLNIYYLPDGEKLPCELGRFEFNAHGDSAQGPNTSTIYVNPEVVLTFKTDKSGTILASTFCNIHGLWTNSLEIKL